MLGHVRMVSIVISSPSCGLVRPDNVPAPEEEAVSDQGANLERFSVPGHSGMGGLITTARWGVWVIYYLQRRLP